MKTKILIISLYYPPINSIASNRIASFTKYLDKNLFDIDIITVKSNSTLPLERRDNLTIYRVSQNPFDAYCKITKNTNYVVRKFKALYNIVVKDYLFKKFKLKALKKAVELYDVSSYDILLSSYAPELTHEVALEIKRKYPSIKWVADMRDEMSLNPFVTQDKKDDLAHLEQNIFDVCDALTTVSKPILDDFIKLSSNKTILFREIRNGFDFEFNNEKSKNNIFTISYIGSFYGSINPNNFLKAIGILLSNKKITNLKIQFIGNSGNFDIPENLKKFIEVQSLVEHNEALELMKNSDALLLIHPNTGRKGVYTGKLFEYLGMNKPILALVDTSDVASQLIAKANAGYSVEENNIEEIQNRFLDIYSQWEKGEAFKPNIAVIKQHHRREQVKRLQLLIEELK